MSQRREIPLPPPERRVYCNRTLNLRAIRAIGFDMDYTLVHYRVDAWEHRAYEHLRQRLVEAGMPVADLEFEPDLFMRGLIVDKERGNVVKANRFGTVKHAFHGTRALPFDELRAVYGRTRVDLAEPRWEFMNTFFSLSEGCMYTQLVDRLDERRLGGVMGYGELYDLVRRTLDFAHMEGRLKAEILADPDRFVDLDPDLPQALMDQRAAGKKLLLITNSDWAYTRPIMTYAFDRFLPRGMTWRDLFDMVIVSARKPSFFTSRMPAFELVDEDGLLRPVLALSDPGRFVGGDARQVESCLGVSGEEILYIGDHLFVDVHVSKDVLRWRTGLVVRELEEELRAVQAFAEREAELTALMAQKDRLEHRYAHARLGLLRLKGGQGPAPDVTPARLHREMGRLREALEALDARIVPLAKASTELYNRRWGLLMRSGNDKSSLARQMEQYADIYTSRVSNLLYLTPYAYLRAPRGSLPHDEQAAGMPDPEA
jgi:HAD superfamily 5'-nucleotidase-like hydrolase